MLAGLKKGWGELREGEPGRRFSARYARAAGRSDRGGLRKWALIVGGALIVLAGILLLPLPGPGFIVIAAGALIMAQESRSAARLLDRLELKVRGRLRRKRRETVP